MSVFDTILSAVRSLVGGGTATESDAPSESTGPRSEGDVSIEHDPDGEDDVAEPTPDATTEAAVKGAEVAGDEGTGDGDDSGPAAAGTDATASTGSLVDEETGKEPAETVGDAGGVDVDRTTGDGEFGGVGVDEAGGGDDGGGGRDETGSGAGDGSGPESGSESEPESETTADGAASESEAAGDADPEASAASVETIKGIGPAYAGRLEGVGIETVADLAGADATTVAEGIDVSESRVRDWIERASDAS